MATPRQTRQSQRTSTTSSSSTVLAPSPPLSPSAKASSSSAKSSDPLSTLRSLALKTKKRKSSALVGAEEASLSKKAARSALPSSSSTTSLIHENGDIDMDGGEVKAKNDSLRVVSSSEKNSREDGEISDDDPTPLSPPSTSSLSTPPNASIETSPLPSSSAILPGMPPPTLTSNGLPLASLPPHAFPPFPPSRPGSTPASNLHFPPLSIPPSSAEPRFPPPSSAFLEAVNAGPIKIHKNKKGKASASMNDKASSGKSDPVAEGAAKLRTTEDSYGESRMLLLELLSWGVSPEYLVKSGLSREAVLVLFTDLKIRLPTNLPGPPPIYEVYDEPSPSESSAVSRVDSDKKPAQVPSSPTASSSKPNPPPPTKPTPSNYVRAVPSGMPAPVAFAGGPPLSGSTAPNGHLPPQPTRSGKDLPPPAPFPNFPPTLSRSNSSQSEVISLISPPGGNLNIALPSDLSSIEAQRRALLVARKNGLEQQRKANEAAAKQAAVDKYKNGKGKGKGKAVERMQVEEKEETKTPVEEEGEFDDQGAASLIEMELAKIGLELAGGMMECEEEKDISPEEDNSSLELEDYDEDQDVTMFDPDGAVGAESNVLFAGLGTSSTEPIKSEPLSPISGLSALLPPALMASSSGETLEVTKDDFVPKLKKASTSKRPVALDFDSKPTTTLPTVAPSTHQHRKRRALVPDRPKRFVIELSDSETDGEDVDHQALPSPSLRSSSSFPFASSSSSSSSTIRRSFDQSNAASSLSTADASSAAAAISELDLEAKQKLEHKEQEIKRMTQLIAAMEAKQKSRSSSSSQQTKSNASTPTLKSAVPLPLASSSTLVTQAEAFLPGAVVGEGASTTTTAEPVEIGLGQSEREGSAERLRGAVEQLQEVKERMEEERDEYLEDLVANGEVVEGSAVNATHEDEELNVVVDASKDEGAEKVRTQFSDAISTLSTVLVAPAPAPEPELPSMTYISPLAAYPSLQATPSTARATRSKKKDASTSSSSSAALTPAQLSTLRNQAMSARHLDPGRQLCRFEQSGGICADSSCHDLHWKNMEPTDDELATFLLGIFGSSGETLDAVRTVVRAAREADNPGTYQDVAQRAATLLHSRR